VLASSVVKAARHGPAYWDGVFLSLVGRRRHLDSWLAAMKRSTYLRLYERWGRADPHGRVLKTDLFEEAMGADATLDGLGGFGAAVIGMDISPAVVRQARANHSAAASFFVAADVRHLPFAPESFTLAVSASTLDHFARADDLLVSLEQLAAILAPAGRIIVTVDNRQNVFDPFLRLAARLGLVPFFLGRSYSIASVTAKLRQAGLEVLDETAILHNPRLLAAGAVGLAAWLRSPRLTRLVRRLLERAQALEHSRWRFRSGSFVAAVAVRRRPGTPS
jgi:SAM-dependent methyltransferase